MSRSPCIILAAFLCLILQVDATGRKKHVRHREVEEVYQRRSRRRVWSSSEDDDEPVAAEEAAATQVALTQTHPVDEDDPRFFQGLRNLVRRSSRTVPRVDYTEPEDDTEEEELEKRRRNKGKAQEVAPLEDQTAALSQQPAQDSASSMPEVDYSTELYEHDDDDEEWEQMPRESAIASAFFTADRERQDREFAMALEADQLKAMGGSSAAMPDLVAAEPPKQKTPDTQAPEPPSGVQEAILANSFAKSLSLSIVESRVAPLSSDDECRVAMVLPSGLRKAEVFRKSDSLELVEHWLVANVHGFIFGRFGFAARGQPGVLPSVFSLEDLGLCSSVLYVVVQN